MSLRRYVQVALDGAGKKLLHLVVKRVPVTDDETASPDPSATLSPGTTDQYVQCVVLVDEDGVPFDPATVNRLLADVLQELQALRREQARATGQGF